MCESQRRSNMMSELELHPNDMKHEVEYQKPLSLLHTETLFKKGKERQ